MDSYWKLGEMAPQAPEIKQNRAAGAGNLVKTRRRHQKALKKQGGAGSERD